MHRNAAAAAGAEGRGAWAGQVPRLPQAPPWLAWRSGPRLEPSPEVASGPFPGKALCPPVPSSGWAADFVFWSSDQASVADAPVPFFFFVFWFFLNSCSTLEPSLEGSHAPPLRDLCKAALGSH